MTSSPGPAQALGVTQSMGRVGSALDNAAAESFNSTLEHELLSRRRFATKDQARREVARFIDAYNHRRRHSSCEMLATGRLRAAPRRASRRSRRTGPGRVKPASQIASEPSITTRWHQSAERMRGSISYQQPSTVSGEAHTPHAHWPDRAGDLAERRTVPAHLPAIRLPAGRTNNRGPVRKASPPGATKPRWPVTTDK